MTRQAVIIGLCVGLVLGAAGCRGADEDPFTGTWRNVDPATKPDTRVVIAKVGDAYRLDVYDESGPLPSAFSLTRHGNELSWIFVPDEPNPPLRLTVTYQPETGHLLMREAVGPTAELEKVSSATSMPSPSSSD